MRVVVVDGTGAGALFDHPSRGGTGLAAPAPGQFMRC
jgi:hypothetical protein